ncbi:MAG: sensor histidine kinase [Chloroflexales bacterium]
MPASDSHINARTLLPVTAALWLGYLLALLVLDERLSPRPIFPVWYYLINGCAATAILGLALWPRGHAWLGRAFLPLVISLLSVVPAVLTQVVAMQMRPGMASSPDALLVRTMPLLVMALVLTAWQYSWGAVILFSGGMAGFTLGLHLLSFRPGGASLVPQVTVVVIQTISLLVVGYFISTLMQRLKQQQASLAQANAKLTVYAATLEELTISRERNRMARELHDTLAHTLSALSVQLEAVKAYWDVDPATAQPMLDTALTATRSGLHETRRALKALRASPLEAMGVALALRQIATETATRANLRLKLAVPERLPALAPAVEQCLYRVAQEATANVAYHANAQTLTVQLRCDGGVTLRVGDDGCGFDPQQAEAAGHFGLAGMRERAQLVGGELTVISQPGHGTTIQLTIASQGKAPRFSSPKDAPR